MCLGYTDSGLTARAFDEDGWYHTGDIGVIDEEGYLTITDRKADIIIRGGENISALEVEEILLSMPGIAEAVVVAAPDARFGEQVAAVLRIQAGLRDADIGPGRGNTSNAPEWPGRNGRQCCSKLKTIRARPAAKFRNTLSDSALPSGEGA